jgi:hypothetical protein
LADCILGTHPLFTSSGELRYLGWQLYRTKDKKGTVEREEVCSCTQDFRDCEYWSKVFNNLKENHGIDMVADPFSLDNAFFGSFSYQNQIEKLSFVDKVKGYVIRLLLERNLFSNWVETIEPKVKKWSENNWKLYSAMAEAGGTEVVVDSSKDWRIALLLHKYFKKSVTIVVLSRSVEGFVAANRRWASKNQYTYSLTSALQEYKDHHDRMALMEKSNPDLQVVRIRYEDMVANPVAFLKHMESSLGLQPQPLKEQVPFAFNPAKSHIVAGNPMRYKGEQQVVVDERWRNELSEEEFKAIGAFKAKYHIN